MRITFAMFIAISAFSTAAEASEAVAEVSMKGISTSVLNRTGETLRVVCNNAKTSCSGDVYTDDTELSFFTNDTIARVTTGPKTHIDTFKLACIGMMDGYVGGIIPEEQMQDMVQRGVDEALNRQRFWEESGNYAVTVTLIGEDGTAECQVMRR